jgi:membrane protein YdbS with pleckstrin-like domain
MPFRARNPEAAMRLFWVLLFVWLLIGAAAAAQRHYFTTSSMNCAGAGTITATILFGPVNYLGADPKFTCH